MVWRFFYIPGIVKLYAPSGKAGGTPAYASAILAERLKEDIEFYDFVKRNFERRLQKDLDPDIAALSLVKRSLESLQVGDRRQAFLFAEKAYSLSPHVPEVKTIFSTCVDQISR